MDGAAVALVTGYTTSSDLPAANNTLQGSYDGFVAKLGGADVPTAPRVLLNAQRFVNSGTPTVTVSAIDNGGGLPDGTTVALDVDLNNDGNFTDSGEQGYTTATLSGGSATFNVTSNLYDGAYGLQARVTDRAGNQGYSDPVPVLVDATAPSVSLSTSSFTNSTTPAITVTAYDSGPFYPYSNPLPDGTAVTLDVDLNNDGNFSAAGEAAYATTSSFLGGSATFNVAPALAQGTYKFRARVSDQAGNEGASDVAAVVVDTTPPTALMSARDNILLGTGDPQDITVTYTDNVAVKLETLYGGGILVTGPHGFSQPAELISVDPNNDAARLTATYHITAPGGTWDAADMGTYTVTLQPDQVTDAGTPLLAAPGQSTVSGNLPALTQAQLQPIVQEAVARWAALGVSPQVLKTMQKTPVIVADLPAAALGEFDHGTITIDRNAAGYGWFVDPTPNRDEEFAAVPAGGEFRAVDPRVVDRMDLLTVVEHELGHASGLKDLDPSALSLMTGQLGTGMRHSAGKAEVDAVLAHAAAQRWL